MTITDEMVERAALALERARMTAYGWTDDQFDIWFHRDPDFVTRIQTWSMFQGTPKQKLFHEVRIVLEAALNG